MKPAIVGVYPSGKTCLASLAAWTSCRGSPSTEGKGLLLTPDLTAISNPLDGGRSHLPGVTAVLSTVEWDTSPAGTIYLEGRISTPNKQVLLALLLAGWTDMRVAFQFQICECDPNASAPGYFVSAGSDAQLHGLLEKNGDELTLDVDNEEAADVPSPKNYAFRIGIKPAQVEQKIVLATGLDRSTVRSWGAAQPPAPVLSR